MRKTMKIIKTKEQAGRIEVPIEIINTAKKSGGSASVTVPKAWIDKRIRCTLED